MACSRFAFAFAFAFVFVSPLKAHRTSSSHAADAGHIGLGQLLSSGSVSAHNPTFFLSRLVRGVRESTSRGRRGTPSSRRR
jgi:hypothetical protein